MQFLLTEQALRDYHGLPEKIQNQVEKQLGHLITDLRHPSLRSKKYSEAENVWQARINRDYRMYFVIVDDTYAVLSIMKHPK